MEFDPESINIPEILKGYNIPPCPGILTDIRNHASDLAKIAELVATDVGLSASVLKTINSSQFGVQQTVLSVRQATMMLGLDTIINIVNAQLIRANFGKLVNVELDDFWVSANDVANSAMVLVKTLGFGSADGAYLLGLFHNCGIPIMVEKFTDYLTTVQAAYSSSEGSIISVEDEVYGTNHAVVGFIVAKQWGLPEHIRIAIRDHHNIERLQFSGREFDTEADTMLAILKMAEHIAGEYATIGKDHEDIEWSKIKDGLLTYLGLSEPDFDDVQDLVREQLHLR